MQESFPLAVDWNDLTDEERYELEIKMAEAYEWEETCGLHDECVNEYEFAPDGIWTEHLIEQEKLKWEAVSFYKNYLECHGEKKPSVVLRGIFYNNDKLLNFFLNRINEEMKEGTEIVIEIKAIMSLQKDKANKLINEKKIGEPLRKELIDLGIKTKSQQNWSAGFGSQNLTRISEVTKEYKVFLERNQ